MLSFIACLCKRLTTEQGMDKNVGDLEDIQSVKTCTNCPQRFSFRTAEWRTSRSNRLAEVHLKMAAEKSIHHHHTTTALWPFFRDHPGELVPEENFLTLWCKGRLTEADTLTIRLGATPSGLTSAHLHRKHVCVKTVCMVRIGNALHLSYVLLLLAQFTAKVSFVWTGCNMSGLLWLVLGVFSNWKCWRTVGNQEEEIDFPLWARLHVMYEFWLKWFMTYI